MGNFQFLIDTYETERLKTLSIWAAFTPKTWKIRPHTEDVRGRTPQEHFIHQCLSENGWMTNMLEIEAGPVLPEAGNEDFVGFFQAYFTATSQRTAALNEKDDAWWLTEVPFFDVPRNRTWVMTRRLTHSAHHRGQLTALLRSWGATVKSTYGPTADTGGLAPAGGQTAYAFSSCEAVLAAIDAGTFGHGESQETTNQLTECG